MHNYLAPELIQDFVKRALHEDIGDGDHSALSAIPAQAVKKARLLVKGEGILAGVELAEHIFRIVNPELKVEVLIKDGSVVKFGDVGLLVEGSARSILMAERLVLNCMQRMSGIATLTQEMVNLVKGTKARLLDTRKTSPNSRLIEKWAVKIGGGQNHRFGLFDMIMLKDNHVDFAGSIEKAILAAQAYLKDQKLNLAIEIETRNLDEVKQAVQMAQKGALQRIMFDNMPLDMLHEAVRLVNGICETEASGGITKASIAGIARSGVDFISVGALTHSYQSMDISLKAY
ncbi:MAG: carboxylating nicotinate-nucleotide diphosphorylase [Cytophagales bacterium]|nr:MAG: carboxylating nicotinate-nucleotide diphosphorylase [Cytophagales bacterium]TAF61379.1 MAG: carboxylating nicotinate-nucleotide diphosphorylase [Cytophagales bacterium]